MTRVPIRREAIRAAHLEDPTSVSEPAKELPDLELDEPDVRPRPGGRRFVLECLLCPEATQLFEAELWSIGPTNGLVDGTSVLSTSTPGPRRSARPPIRHLPNVRSQHLHPRAPPFRPPPDTARTTSVSRDFLRRSGALNERRNCRRHERAGFGERGVRLSSAPERRRVVHRRRGRRRPRPASSYDPVTASRIANRVGIVGLNRIRCWTPSRLR
jgi:hypothetical protein